MVNLPEGSGWSVSSGGPLFLSNLSGRSARSDPGSGHRDRSACLHGRPQRRQGLRQRLYPRRQAGCLSPSSVQGFGWAGCMPKPTPKTRAAHRGGLFGLRFWAARQACDRRRLALLRRWPIRGLIKPRSCRAPDRQHLPVGQPLFDPNPVPIGSPRSRRTGDVLSRQSGHRSSSLPVGAAKKYRHIGHCRFIMPGRGSHGPALIALPFASGPLVGAAVSRRFLFMSVFLPSCLLFCLRPWRLEVP